MGELVGAVRAFQRGTDEMDEVAAHVMGINRTDGRCIDVLDEHGRMTAGDLASRTGLTSGAITGVVDRLERAGFVRRVRDDADRRRVFVELTPKARQAAERLYSPLAEKSASFLEGLSDAELETVIRFLRAGTDVMTTHARGLHAQDR